MISGQLHVPATLPLDRNLGTHRPGDWVGPTPAVGVLEKKYIEARIFQSFSTEKVAKEIVI